MSLTCAGVNGTISRGKMNAGPEYMHLISLKAKAICELSYLAIRAQSLKSRGRRQVNVTAVAEPWTAARLRHLAETRTSIAPLFVTCQLSECE